MISGDSYWWIENLKGTNWCAKSPPKIIFEKYFFENCFWRLFFASIGSPGIPNLPIRIEDEVILIRINESKNHNIFALFLEVLWSHRIAKRWRLNPGYNQNSPDLWQGWTLLKPVLIHHRKPRLECSKNPFPSFRDPFLRAERRLRRAESIQFRLRKSDLNQVCKFFVWETA